MTDIEQKTADIIAAGRMIYQRQLVAGTDGNISIRCGESILITAANISKGLLTAADITLIDLNANPLMPEIKPSSEAAMHAAIYRADPAVGAIVHAHPPFATAYALTEQQLPEDMVESQLVLGEIPVLPYCPAGSKELAEQVSAAATGHKGALLAKHGAITWAADIRGAVYLLEAMEQVAKTGCIARILKNITN